MAIEQFEALILDWDHTVAQCVEIFHTCKAEFSAFAAECIPLIDAATALDRYHAHDVVKLKRRDYRPERAMESMDEVLRMLALEHDVALPPGAVEMARAIGRKIVDFDYPLYDGALEVLKGYRAQGVRMAIYTKGTDFEFQRRKVARWGVDKLVDIVEPTPSKTREGFLGLAAALGVSPELCVSVGDSEADDILIAHEAGLQTVHITQRLASASFDSVNKAERQVVADASISRLSELPTVLPYSSLVTRKGSSAAPGVSRGGRQR